MIRRILPLGLLFTVFGFVQTEVMAQCGTTPVAGDMTIASNTTLSGTYNISGVFTVNAGVTVTVESFASNGCGELVINAAEINIVGDIIADGAGFVGGTGGGGGTSGNNTDALTGCVDKDNCLVIDVDPGVGGAAASGPGAGAGGSNGTQGVGPKQQCQNFGDEFGFVPGAGGAGGGGGGSYAATGGSGAAGGNGAAYNSGNFSGMGIAGCASPTAGTGGGGGTPGAAYGTPTGTDIDKGSGGAGAGGGGKSASNGAFASNGGNGGGLIILNSTGVLSVLGTVSASGSTGGAGGAGGNGGITTDCCTDACNECGERTYSSGAGGGAGGGGGSGGGIYITAMGLATVTGTLRTEGGNGGSAGSGGNGTSACTYNDFFCGSNSGSSNAGSAGNLGGGGSGGRIKIFQNACLPNNLGATFLLGGGNGNGGAASIGSSHIGDLPGITPPTVSVTSDSTSCFGLMDGSATAVVSGGTAPFTYSWSPSGGNSDVASGLAAGLYSVTVTDDNGCEVTESVVVEQPDTLTVAIFGVLDVDCFGANNGEASAMSFGGTLPHTYAWDDPMLQIGTTAQNLPAGTWTVTVTDDNGCTAAESVDIIEPAAFDASATVDQNVSCFGGNDGQATATVNGGGIVTYQWDDPSNQTTAVAGGLPAGTWTVTVSSSSTCDTVISVTITEPAELLPIAVENTPISCNGGADGIAAVTQTGGTGPFTYQWDDPNLQTSDIATGLEAGTYNVVVTDDNGCTASASVDVTEPAPIVIAVDITHSPCFGENGGEITANVSGGTSPYTYLWDDALSQTTQTATGLIAGSYEVVVTDDNGCTGTFSNIILNEASEIVITLDPVENVSCFGGSDASITSNVTGGTPGYTYQWDDPANQTTSMADGLSTGSYILTVTDSSGCVVSTQTTVIVEPDSLIASAGVNTPVTCVGGDDGDAEVLVTGGTGPYSYQWNDEDGQTGMIAIGLQAGDYSVVVTDNNGCVDSAMVTVDPPVDSLIANFTIDPQSGLQPLTVHVDNQSTGGDQFIWTWGDGNMSETFNLDTFSYSYEDSGSIEIMMVAFDILTGCSDTAFATLYITPTSLLDIPNVFTPDGDNFNDVFLPDVRNLTSFHGQIFNRWGEKVYDWNGSRGGWDGRSVAGIELPAGTYYYVISGVGVDGINETEYEFNGSVTLIR